MTTEIHKKNVGRIAERIVANELEARGFIVNDLNRDGLSANADLLVSCGGKTLQIQVKGSTKTGKLWGVHYGYCTQEIIDNPALTVFNRHDSFYRADVVILVAIQSLTEYRCIVLPVEQAEEAAQINIQRYYRMPKKDGEPHKPGKIYLQIEGAKNPKKICDQMDRERAIIQAGENNWALIWQ